MFKIDKNEEKTLTEGNHLDNQQENEFKHRSVKELFNKRRGRKNE